MKRFLSLSIRRKSSASQIINSVVWASVMIISALLVNDMHTNEFLVMIYIAGWFITTFPQGKDSKTT